MAWTVTREPSVLGNKRVAFIKLLADAATQTVETGLSVIDCISWGPASLTSALPKCWINSNASGVQSNGVLGCSGFTSGDVFYVTVYGK